MNLFIFLLTTDPCASQSPLPWYGASNHHHSVISIIHPGLVARYKMITHYKYALQNYNKNYNALQNDNALQIAGAYQPKKVTHYKKVP